MKSILYSMVALVAFISVVHAETQKKDLTKSNNLKVKWYTDFNAAKEASKSQNKPIFIDFSGSDWCGWCMRLEDEVLSKKEFKEYAKDNLILVIADFPRRKEISAKIKKQNRALMSEYGVRGFPTVLLLDSDGKVLARTGYQSGGAKAYVKHISSLLAKTKYGKK